MLSQLGGFVHAIVVHAIVVRAIVGHLDSRGRLMSGLAGEVHMRQLGINPQIQAFGEGGWLVNAPHPLVAVPQTREQAGQGRPYNVLHDSHQSHAHQ